MTANNIAAAIERRNSVDDAIDAIGAGVRSFRRLLRRFAERVAMAINAIATTERNSMCDALVDAIDAGAGAGLFEVHTAAFAAKLGTMTFNDPASGAASVGVATFNAITSDSSADATGTAAVLRVTSSTPTTVYEGTVTATSGGGDLELSTIGITIGDTISCTSKTVTMPAGA